MVDGYTIVVVDDEQEIRDVVALLLRPTQLRIVGEAPNGLEAISLALRLQPDVILLDQRMPVMTGEETAEALRQASPGSLIVAFSAYLEGKPPWADGYLPKDHLRDISTIVTNLIAAKVATV